MSDLKDQLRRSVLMHDLGVEILTGEDASDAFDADKRAEEMRIATAAAVARLNELLMWLKREHDDKPEGDDAA